MDTIPPLKLRPKKFVTKDSTGGRFYKKAGYICEVCPYAEDKVCAVCIFARWNVEGVMAGYHPSEAYRIAHKDDVSASPLMVAADGIHLNLPRVPVPSHNALARLARGAHP